jgi:hypothetical protein
LHRYFVCPCLNHHIIFSLEQWLPFFQIFSCLF